MQGRAKGLIVDTQSSSEGNTAGEKWVEAREVKGLCEEVSEGRRGNPTSHARNSTSGWRMCGTVTLDEAVDELHFKFPDEEAKSESRLK